jgi:hypothetical protein
MSQLEQSKVDEWLAKWQPILKLVDWNIKAEVQRGFDMENDHAEGENGVTLVRKSAWITIRDTIDSRYAKTWPPDPERTLVHELIHCHFDPFLPKDRESLEYKMAEQAIDVLATAFIEQDRKGK